MTAPPAHAGPTAGTIQRRLLGTVATLVVLTAAITAIGQLIVASTAASVGAEINTTDAIQRATRQLEFTLVREEAITLGCAVSRDPDALEQFEAVSEDELDAYLALAPETSGDRVLDRAVAEVRATATEWRETWAEPLLRSGDADSTGLFAEGERLFAPVQAALTNLRSVTEARRAAASEAWASQANAPTPGGPNGPLPASVPVSGWCVTSLQYPRTGETP